MSEGTQEGSSSSGTVMMVEGSAAPAVEEPRRLEEGRGWTKSRPWRTSQGKEVAQARGLEGSPPWRCGTNIFSEY